MMTAVQQVQLELAKLRDRSKRKYFEACLTRKRYGVRQVQSGVKQFDSVSHEFFSTMQAFVTELDKAKVAVKKIDDVENDTQRRVAAMRVRQLLTTQVQLQWDQGISLLNCIEPKTPLKDVEKLVDSLRDESELVLGAALNT
eukprot:CAMPEP_0168599656 /NCGR_PEP_ID=MMETSP0420-20121227/12224_1 /TAXON_ID=498008 /ORGANISM="Pessonella sp." /LENGTH=141 /DNA_ID=CAMNT_0008637409 /DNA_START=235 /DNA_END=656 /DNA_ORIENTATION=+